MRTLFLCSLIFLLAGVSGSAAADDSGGPLRLAIVGLTHGHSARTVTRALSRPDVKLIGIVEPDEELVVRAMERHKLPRALFHRSLDEVLSPGAVEAVAVFTSTFEHREVIEICAARGVHVMVEKPLAVSREHARAIDGFAAKGGIHVLVNYEPIWSPAYQQAFKLVHDEHTLGDIRKFVAHDGNDGPVGKSPAEFVRWLIDPKLNGGGALYDFGCYGAAVACWLTDNERPTSVFATLQNIKPREYPRVEDDATVVLTYPNKTGIIMASWNWPVARKDFEVYGAKGYVTARFPNEVRTRAGGKEQLLEGSKPPADWADPLTYLRAVARNRVRPSGPPSLKTNLLVTEILDAARESHRTGRRIDLRETP